MAAQQTQPLCIYSRLRTYMRAKNAAEMGRLVQALQQSRAKADKGRRRKRMGLGPK